MKSESINELAAALAKAQQEIKPALKDAENPFFRSKYADLNSTWDACRDALNKNGLSIVQTLGNDNITTWLNTLLIHTSGQWISGNCPLINTKNDMQGLGSAISYARRYSIAAICGVVTEDDDAATAVEKPKDPAWKSPGDVKSIKGNSFITNSIPPSAEKITPNQAKMVYAKINAKGYKGPDFMDVLSKISPHYRFTEDIPYNKLDEALAFIDKLPQFKKNPKDIPDTVIDDLPWPDSK